MQQRSLLLLLVLLCTLLLLSPSTRAQPGYDDEELDVEDEAEGVEEEVFDDTEHGGVPPAQQQQYRPPPAPLAPGPRAKLIIHKRLITPIPGVFAAHRPINVSIICYNVGDLPAHTVTIGDNWGDLFDITIGTNTTEIDVLEVNEHAELNFTVIPQREGHFTGGAATATYSAQGEGSRLQQAYSSGYRSFTIYPQDVYDKYARSKTVTRTQTSETLHTADKSIART